MRKSAVLLILILALLAGYSYGYFAYPHPPDRGTPAATRARPAATRQPLATNTPAVSTREISAPVRTPYSGATPAISTPVVPESIPMPPITAGVSRAPMRQQVLPLGFYIWTDMERDLRVISEAGFNIVHLTPTLVGRHAFLPILDQAQTLGLKVIVEIDQDDVNGDVAVYKRKTAVVGYALYDDCIANTGPEIAERVSQVHRLDPRRFAMVACGDYAGDASRDAAWADVAGAEIYSLTTADGGHVTGPTIARYADAAMAKGNAAICVCQSYPNGGRDPSADQVRSQTWTALAAGAEGILYYSFQDSGDLSAPDNLDQRNPPLWSEFSTLAHEVLSQTWLSSGAYTRLVNSDSLTVGKWTVGDATYLVATASDLGPQQVDIPVGTGVATKVFDRYADLTIKDARLVGTLPRYGVAVYQIG